MKKWGFALTAVLLLVTPLVVAAAGPNPGTGNAKIYAMNLDSGGSAHVVVDYYNQYPPPDIAYSDSATVAYAGHASWDTQVSGLPSAWLGSAILSSDRPIAAVSHLLWTGGAVGDGATAAGYTGFTQGANTVYAPALFKRTYQSSKVTVQNTETGDAAVTVEFYTRGVSTPVYTLNDTIPGGAQRTYDVWDYAQIPDFGPDPGTDNWVGAAKITSPQKVAVVVTTFWNWGSGSYSGVSTPSTKLYVPSIFKKKFANWQIYSGAIIMNPNASDAHLTMYFYNRDGTLAVPAVSQTIAPFASEGFNTRYDSDPGGSNVFTAVSNDWNGLAIIESDVPVVGIVNIIWRVPSNQTGSYSMGTDATDASLKLAYPIRTKRNFGTWEKWSGAIYQNTTGSTASVDTTFYNSDGTVAKGPFNVSIPGHGAQGYNTRYNTGLFEAPPTGLPADWEGTVIVVSSQPIVGIMNNIWSNQTATYNAALMP